MLKKIKAKKEKTLSAGQSAAQSPAQTPTLLPMTTPSLRAREEATTFFCNGSFSKKKSSPFEILFSFNLLSLQSNNLYF